MEQQQRSLIFTAAVGLIILSIIIGSIYYLVKFIQGRVKDSGQSVQTVENFNPESTQSAELVPGASTSETQNGQVSQSDNNSSSEKKVYNAGTFQLVYPDTWGLLSCSNSVNIELDPANSNDAAASCDVASKPITVIIGDTRGCEGEVVKIGSFDAVKTKVNDGAYIKYQWCTKTEPVLNITHRVSPDGERATSKEDYSNQIEQIISNLSFIRGS